MQVDAGGYFEPLGPRSARVNETMLEGLKRLPVDVLNLTPADIHEWTRLAGAEGPTQVISSNLVPRDASIPAPRPSAVVEVPGPAGPVRIGFLGVSDPATVKPNSGFRAIAPRQALESQIAELDGRVDVVVLLADLSADEAAQLAEAFREIDVVVRGEPRSLAPSPRIAGAAVIVSSVERGRSLGKLTLKLSSEGRVDSAEPEWISLEKGLPEDPYFKRREAELEAAP